ncbi:hypothetical protein [Pseudonocardia spinosispora]|nr:hypothetical protein [Pseudonocardia spinosispora]
MTSTLWIMLFIGAVPGYYLGRWRAENRRARFDQDNVWKGRHKYRDGD